MREHVRKAFAYAVRRDQQGGFQLLVFRSHEEFEGFEVPKGALEPGESFVDAARREFFEEVGLTVDSGEELGETWYFDEEQRFFLFVLPHDVPDRFRHAVTGRDGDAGTVYEFEFLPVDERLASRLVQGSGAFAGRLLQRLPGDASLSDPSPDDESPRD